MEHEEPNTGWVEALGEHASNPPNPRQVGEVLHALGRDWTVSSCENRLKAQFEFWVRKNALLAIQDADLINPEEGAKMRSAYLADRGAKHYNWEGRYCRNALCDWPGLQHLLYLLLRRCQPDITEDQVAEIFTDNPRGAGLAIAWALGNSQTPARGKATTKLEKRNNETKATTKLLETMDD